MFEGTEPPPKKPTLADIHNKYDGLIPQADLDALENVGSIEHARRKINGMKRDIEKLTLCLAGLDMGAWDHLPEDIRMQRKTDHTTAKAECEEDLAEWEITLARLLVVDAQETLDRLLGKAATE